MPKKATLFLPLILIIPLAFFLKFRYAANQPGNPYLVINDHRISAEIADTDDKRMRGLSGRSNLPADNGMLFIFPYADFYGFWMKEMNFPLDFIWIKGDRVAGITANVSPPNIRTLTDLPVYKPSVPVDKVLEVGSGTVKKLDIKIGDKVTYYL